MGKQVRKVVRNPELIPGVRRYGKSLSSHKRGRWLHGKKGDQRPESQRTKPVPSTDLTAPKYYSPYDINKPVYSRKHNHKPSKLRKTITPGKVLIVLAGKFAGKRVIFLKQLESGLLLVTGPYALNGVPLRRLNAAYVIATSTKLNISKVEISKLDDTFFAKSVEKNKKGGFLDEKKEKTPLPDSKKSEQSRVDGLLTPLISKVPQLTEYLKKHFSLAHGQKPHLMRF